MLKGKSKNKLSILFFTIFLIIPLILFSLFYNFDKLSSDFEGKLGGIIYKFLYNTKSFVDPSFKFKYIIPFDKSEIDVAIPLIEKDIEIAKHTIQSVRDFVMHPIKKIYIVSPESEILRNFAKENDCEFVLESTLFDDYNEVKSVGGWVLQQMIKFNMDKVSKADNLLLVDADTIFLRPQVFKIKDINLINVHWEYGRNRRILSNKILKIKKAYPIEFVCHHFFFDKNVLKQFKFHIEKVHNKKWDKVLLEFAKLDSSGFSEGDLYYTYLTEKTNNYRLMASANVTLYRDKISSLSEYRKSLSSEFKSLSSHSFITTERETSNG